MAECPSALLIHCMQVVLDCEPPLYLHWINKDQIIHFLLQSVHQVSVCKDVCCHLADQLRRWSCCRTTRRPRCTGFDWTGWCQQCVPGSAEHGWWSRCWSNGKNALTKPLLEQFKDLETYHHLLKWQLLFHQGNRNGIKTYKKKS